MPPSKIPSSLKRPSSSKSRSVSIDPQGLLKKIYTPVPNENSWQTDDEKRGAIGSLEDKEPKYVRRPKKNINLVNAEWEAAIMKTPAKANTNEQNPAKADGSILNRKNVLFLTAAMAGVAAATALSRKSRKGGARKTRKNKK